MKLLIRITILLFSLSSGPSFAYGDLGHEMIIRLAEPYFTDATREALRTWLPDEELTDIAWWADYMRNSQRDSEFWSYRHSSNWHFVNVPPGENYADSDTAPEGDIVMAVKAFTGILQDQPPESGPIHEGLLKYRQEFPDQPDPFTDKGLALRFLIHFIADIHQPLHTGYGADSGGNSISVEWFGRQTNLHAVWDTQLVRSLAPGDDQLFARLSRDLERVPEEEFRLAGDSTVDDWVAEGLRIRETVYESAENGSYLAARYASAYANTTRNQLLKAAIRTAATLNAIFQ